MLDSKLARLKELINEKERIDRELSVLLGETEKPKRGRPKKEGGNAPPSSSTGA